MGILPDKLIFFLIGTSFYLHMAEGPFQVVPVIIAVIVSATGSLINKPVWRIVEVLSFTAASLYIPDLLFFLPLICMDLFSIQYPWLALLSAIPVFYHLSALDLLVPFQLVLLTLLAWLFVRRAQITSGLREHAQKIRDDATEAKIQLQQKQKDLLEKQDYEKNMVRLRERNRIAREIHDHLGHQLSRAIIQLGALKIICKDKEAAGHLESVTNTLTEGMDNIRQSVHELYEQSQPIQKELHRLTSQFEFCPVTLEYKLKNEPPQSIRNALLAIVKEGLTNVMKHSNATQVKITLFEHPVFYQLIIADNGKGQTEDSHSTTHGMGLESMHERVENLHGTMHLSRENGFRIFINIPKG